MNQTIRRSAAERIATVMQDTAPPLSADSIARLRKVQAEIRAFLEAQEPASSRTQEPASDGPQEPASSGTQEPAPNRAQEPTSQEAQESSPVDAAWVVMEAANDFGDQATIDACRRVIDASLNGALAAQSDVVVINNYFK
jgi:hypothetical protein